MPERPQSVKWYSCYVSFCQVSNQLSYLKADIRKAYWRVYFLKKLARLYKEPLSLIQWLTDLHVYICWRVSCSWLWCLGSKSDHFDHFVLLLELAKESIIWSWYFYFEKSILYLTLLLFIVYSLYWVLYIFSYFIKISYMFQWCKL